MALLELHEVCKTYHLGEMDLQVLKGVTLSVAQGEMVALMGASGSGKSTLMNILGCLDRPTSGEYWLDGKEISGASANERAKLRNQLIGFVFQSFNLLSRTSALENVCMPLTYGVECVPEHEMHARAREMLCKVGLSERMNHQPSQLSGGQQQRVAIARSLINRPPLLLADEPTGNLDSRTSEEILQMFKDLNEREGLTIILVTHDPEVALHAKRTIRIRDGLIAGEAEGGGEEKLR
jgi:ABC-type lipoprotein export system ATPase subunit